jgi:hypothetical protein
VAPVVTAVAPVGGAVGVAPGAAVTVAFGEPMDQAATQAAFSLRAASGPAVAGTFVWSGTTLTFRPSAPLAKGVTYTATVATGARDAAGNPLAAARTWSFTTVRALTAVPASAAVETGSAAGGTFADLRADDVLTYRVASSSSGTRTSSWRAAFAGVPRGLANLRVTYKGSNSRSCTQEVFAYRWATGAWVRLDARSVGTTEVALALTPGGAPADYVSAAGELRVRVRCATSSGGFTARGNLLTIGYDAP